MSGENSATQHATLWQELVTSALLGTERRDFAVPSGDDALGKLLAALEGQEGEKRLMGAAGAIAVYRRAGALPQVDSTSMPEPCEPDEMPCCSGRAGQHLSTMLNGQYAELLGEWFRTLAQAGKRVPEELLPAVLDLARTNGSFREPIEPVLGKRGAWLAAQRADWSATFLLQPAEADTSVWETGDRDTRLMLLAKLRVEGRSGRARELVQETWTMEGADTRAAFVRAFERNLSIDDEPFLEAALDDKSKQVREAAAALLATLPESRLVARMRERVKPLLSFVEQKNLLGARKNKISVTLPEQLDKSATRDGIEPKAKAGRGEKTGWLIEMLERVPPSTWSTEWGKAPQEIIVAAFDSDWKDALLRGWITATKTFKDVEWTEAFVARGPINLQASDSAELLSVLSPERREAIITDILRAKKNPLATKDLSLRMLWQMQTPWGAEVSRAVLRTTLEYIHGTAKQGDWEMNGSLIYFARAISPDILEEATAILSVPEAERTFYSDSLDKFAAVVQFRHEMLRELR